MKKSLSVLFFLISCAAFVCFYCVELSFILECVIGALVIIPSRYFLLEKPYRWQSLAQISDNYRIPHYNALLFGLLALYMASPFLMLLPVFSFYRPANNDLMYLALFMNCINCLILAIYQFRPELLHLKNPPEETAP